MTLDPPETCVAQQLAVLVVGIRLGRARVVRNLARLERDDDIPLDRGARLVVLGAFLETEVRIVREHALASAEPCGRLSAERPHLMFGGHFQHQRA